jgi:NAD(P)-dependent dehydrogenase (short-subunit alcohol dehydrogenase family)
MKNGSAWVGKSLIRRAATRRAIPAAANAGRVVVNGGWATTKDPGFTVPLPGITVCALAMTQVSEKIPKVALVTGGAQRLGQAIVLALATEGFDVAIHFNTSRGEAEATQAAVRSLGQRAILLQADLGNEAQVEQLIPQATEHLGPVGVLVNNASRFDRDEWHDVSRTSWDHHLSTNLRAPFVLIQAFARALAAPAEGVVINMIDQRVWSLTPHFVSYTISKAGLWTLTQTMALALAPRVRVNAIGPGPALPSPRQTEAQFALQSASVPLGHGTSPPEIGRAVTAILGLPAMTGQMIALDGGQHLQWAAVHNKGAPDE